MLQFYLNLLELTFKTTICHLTLKYFAGHNFPPEFVGFLNLLFYVKIISWKMFSISFFFFLNLQINAN